MVSDKNRPSKEHEIIRLNDKLDEYRIKWKTASPAYRLVIEQSAKLVKFQIRVAKTSLGIDWRAEERIEKGLPPIQPPPPNPQLSFDDPQY